jgi:hypothetical protein
MPSVCCPATISSKGLNRRSRPIADIQLLSKVSCMSAFEVAHAGRESAEPFTNCLFEVTRNGRKVAELSHDYRGDEHWMRLPGGQWIALPNRIIEGGGPQPLAISSAGVKALDRLLD